MASPDDFSIVPPPPSYPTESYKNYKVFPDFVEEAMDKILSEEANLEESRSNDWPFYSGADGSGDSPSSYALRSGDTGKPEPVLSTPRVLTKSKAKKTIKSIKPKKKRSAATREITVIDLCDDDEDAMPKDMEVDHDKHDEPHDSQEVNGDVNPQVVDTPADDSDDKTEFFDDVEGGAGTVNVNIVNPKTVNVNIVNAKTVESGPVHVKTIETNVSADENITVSKNGVRHSEEDFKEEEHIFSCVTESVKGHVLHFIVAHPFMSQFVQPVKRSARRQFITDMCKEALSKGLDPGVIWDLIKYVRRIYLDRAGVRAEPLAPGLEDIPFGEEVEDDHESRAPSRKSHKRSRKEGSPGLKNKRNKRRLLDAQKPAQPVAVPEVIEIADDDTNPPSPELVNSPSHTKDEQTTVVQVQSIPDSPLNPIDTNGDEVPHEVVENHVVESTPELPSQPLNVRAQENYEGATTVQVKSTPDLPLETGDATVSQAAETLSTDGFIRSSVPIERTISAHDMDEGHKDAQEASNLSMLGECANDEIMPESRREPEISPQAAADRMPENSNPTLVPEHNEKPPATISKSKKRKARRQLLQKALQEEKATEAKDDAQPTPPLQKLVVCGVDNTAPATHKCSEPGTSVNGDRLPGNLGVSNGLPKATTTLIPESLFPDLPSEATSKTTTKLSKNQKRQERKRARREKKERKKQERIIKELNAQQQPTESWLKHHNILNSPNNPAQAMQTKKTQALCKPPAIDPEPRKEKKRKEREHKREQKRERKRKRESLKLEANSNTIDDGQNQDDLLANEAHELDKQKPKRQGKKQWKEERKPQERSLASHHDGDHVEDDAPTPDIPLLDGSTESHKRSNDRGEDVVSSDHDEPKARVYVALETPQPEDTVAKKSFLQSSPQPQTPVKSTPQREVAGAEPMPLSTPASQCTSASRPRYGPLSPDPREWDTDF
jgi:hypothetical protein